MPRNARSTARSRHRDRSLNRLDETSGCTTRISGIRHRSDDGNTVGTGGEQLSDPFDGNTGDSDKGDVDRSRDPAEHGRPERVGQPALRGRRVDRADTEVARPRRLMLRRQLRSSCCASDRRQRPDDRTGSCYRQIILTDMHPGGTGCNGNVRSVVQDTRSANRGASIDNLDREFVKRGIDHLLCSQLEHRRPAGQNLVDEAKVGVALARSRVDDHMQTAQRLRVRHLVLQCQEKRANDAEQPAAPYAGIIRIRFQRSTPEEAPSQPGSSRLPCNGDV